MEDVQHISILGSTGSVGTSTLDVVRRHSTQYRVDALTAHTQIELLHSQILEFKPRVVVVADAQRAQALRDLLSDSSSVDIRYGPAALADVAADERSPTVMSAIVGAAGLVPTLAAVQAGKKVLIANKEPLVMTGDLFMQTAHKAGATVLPIDSEHNAIFQCLPSDQSLSGVAKLHLTASGGPFLGREWSSLSGMTASQACAHPNWSMGPKISVDSATMMNKGLELIEASALFSITPDRINIVVHPQSIIHSLVEYVDGSFLAQLGSPDMKIPIAHALAWPSRCESGAQTLSLSAISRLDFHEPDLANIPCLALAIQAAKAGGLAPIVLNAANEIAVDAFLNDKIMFTYIPVLIEAALEQFSGPVAQDVEAVLNIDNEVRRWCEGRLSSVTQSSRQAQL